MDQAGIIRDLLSWLEKIWITPCRWTTGRQGVIQMASTADVQRHYRYALGAYIRARRLSKTAVYTTALMPAGQWRLAWACLILS